MFSLLHAPQSLPKFIVWPTDLSSQSVQVQLGTIPTTEWDAPLSLLLLPGCLGNLQGEIIDHLCQNDLFPVDSQSTRQHQFVLKYFKIKGRSRKRLEWMTDINSGIDFLFTMSVCFPPDNIARLNIMQFADKPIYHLLQNRLKLRLNNSRSEPISRLNRRWINFLWNNWQKYTFLRESDRVFNK